MLSFAPSVPCTTRLHRPAAAFPTPHSPLATRTPTAPMTITGSQDQSPKRRLRLGMVGGGRGAFIGAVHRIAARLDDRWELVAGALSSDPERAKASGQDLLLKPDRIYADFSEMARRERRLKG